MRPKFSVNAVRFGILKLGRFKRLYASARNSSFTASVRGISFCSERSNSRKPGPIAAFLGALPKVYSAGSEKTEVLNHSSGVFGPSFGLPITFGRWAGPEPILA